MKIIPLLVARFNPEDGVSTVLRNVGIQIPHYTEQEPRKSRIRLYRWFNPLYTYKFLMWRSCLSNRLSACYISEITRRISVKFCIGSIATRLWTRPEFDSLEGLIIFFFATKSRPDLGGPPSLLSGGYRVLCPLRWSSRDMGLATRLHLAPRFGTRGAVPPLPNTSSCRGA
jgi:hypothetical protein